LLRCNERYSRTLVFPAAILMIQSLLNTGIDLWANYGPFYMPLLRAFSPLCIGVLTYYFSTTDYCSKLKKHHVAYNLAAVISLISIFVFANHDVIFLITTPVVILACMDETSWINLLLNRKIFRSFGKLSYAVYLNHALIQRITFARIVPRIHSMGLEFPMWQQAGVYFVLLTAYSVITMLLVDKLCAHFRKKATV